MIASLLLADQLHDLVDRIDGAERVRHVIERDDFGFRGRAARAGNPGRAARPRSARRSGALRRFSRASCCQGTKFAWCSSAVTTISSPRDDVGAAPRADATRLSDSVVPRVKMRQSGSRDAEKAGDRGLGRRDSVGRAHRERVRSPVGVGVAGLVELANRIEHHLRLLGGRRRVEVVEAGVVGEEGEIGAELHGTVTVEASYFPSILWHRGPTRIVSPSIRTRKTGSGLVAGTLPHFAGQAIEPGAVPGALDRPIRRARRPATSRSAGGCRYRSEPRSGRCA